MGWGWGGAGFDFTVRPIGSLGGALLPGFTKLEWTQGDEREREAGVSGGPSG